MSERKSKLAYGVGTMDADYAVKKYENWHENGCRKQKLLWICPFYMKWNSMLQRCYSEKFLEKYPTYRGFSVCQEWLTFSNFKAWMKKQDWERKHLDKDILFPGNKIYSPSTCVFIDPKVNTFITESNASRGEWLIGVCWHKAANKFISMCRDGSGKRKHLGLFDTELESHKAWVEYKLKLAYQLAAEQSDERIAQALIARYENYLSGKP